ALYIAESYGILTYLLGVFVNIHPCERKLIKADLDDPALPTVDVFIPTYNEPAEIILTAATASINMKYPKDKLNVYILDDGGTVEKRNSPDPAASEKARRRHEELKAMASFLNIGYITREKNLHAKAGNITNALASDTNGELTLILDCDHNPSRDLLINTVVYFMKDEKLFLVQTPHFFINPDPIEKNLGTFRELPAEGELFFGAIQKGLDFWNSSFFCGSAAVIRRKYLEEIGGIATDTITEDAETSLMLHAKGYNSVYVDRPMICGLAPETFSDFILQHTRWATGMLQILLLKNPLFQKGLKFYQRLGYLNSCIYWLFGYARVIFMLAPMAYLFFGANVYNATISQVITYAIPHLVSAVILTDYLYGRVRHTFVSELYETVQSFFVMPVLTRALLRPRSPKFLVTPKGTTLASDFASPLASPFYFLFFASLIAYPVALWRWQNNPLQQHGIIGCLIWVTFNFIMLLLCLGIVWEKRQIRTKHRIPVDKAAVISVPFKGTRHNVKVFDISESGIGLTSFGHLALSPGDDVLIDVSDSYGNEYKFRMKITRVVPADNNQIIGCEFLSTDDNTASDIIGFLYGDSEIFNRFWERRRERSAGIWKGIGYLFTKGVTGTANHFAGLLKQFFDFLKNKRRSYGSDENLGQDKNKKDEPDVHGHVHDYDTFNSDLVKSDSSGDTEGSAH
ncbi:MAG: UDP-forming cellulose synthase catalytic subunit, partial [Nitrospirota bacterium]